MPLKKVPQKTPTLAEGHAETGSAFLGEAVEG